MTLKKKKNPPIEKSVGFHLPVSITHFSQDAFSTLACFRDQLRPTAPIFPNVPLLFRC